MPRIPWYIAAPVFAGGAYLIGDFVARQMLFQPAVYPEGSWALQSRIAAKDVWLDRQEGVRVHGWFVQAPASRLVTLFFHGNAGNIAQRVPRFVETSAAGSSLMMFDYRGFGRSTGKPSEKSLYEDADAAYEYLLKNGYLPENIVFQGESLGTAVAVDMAVRHKCAGLILEAPFTSVKEVAQTVVPYVGPLFVSGFDSKARIAAVKAPILIIHGDHDEIIPLRFGRALFDAAPQPKSFWLVKGAGHNDLIEIAGDSFRSRLSEFYSSLPL